MKLTTATFMTGLMLITINSNASITPGTHQAGISLGASNPLSYSTVDGDRAEFGEIGAAFGASYLYQLLPNIAVGGDLSYKNFGDKDIYPHGTGTVDSSAWTMLAIGRGDFIPAGDLRPYGLLGLGLGRVKREVRFPSAPFFDRDRTSGGFAAALGAGVDFDINASWLVGAELRWSYIDTDDNEVGTSSVRTMDLNVKAGYKF